MLCATKTLSQSFDVIDRARPVLLEQPRHGAIREQPWVHKGKIRKRHVTRLALSFDHRLVDGGLGSRLLSDVAAAHGCTPGQVALAWLNAQGDDVVPIPGTKRRSYLEDNVGALDVTLTADDLERLGALEPAGDRAVDMTFVNRDTPPKA